MSSVLVEDLVTAKNRLTILGLVVVLILLSACAQSPTPVPDKPPTPVPEIPVLTEEDVIGLVSTYIQATWEGKGTFVPCDSFSRPSIILKAKEESSARYIGQQVWIVKFSDCGTFLVNDRTGAVASP